MTNGITPLMNTDRQNVAEGAGSRIRLDFDSFPSATMYHSLHGSVILLYHMEGP